MAEFPETGLAAIVRMHGCLTHPLSDKACNKGPPQARQAYLNLERLFGIFWNYGEPLDSYPWAAGGGN